MSDQFDKKLVNKINEIFDNFEDDSANDGWTELRKRFPEKKSKPKFLWWFSSAAAALLLCGVWFFSNQHIENNSEIAKISDKLPLKKLKDTEPILNAAISSGKSIENIPGKQESGNEAQGPSFKTKNHKDHQGSNRKQDTLQSSDEAIKNPSKIASQEDFEHNLTLIALVPDPAQKTEEHASKQLLASDTADSKSHIVIASNTNSNETYPAEVISREELSGLVQADKAKGKSKADKKLVIGFFAGTYFNYAEGSETNINTGIGLTSDIKISRKIKISTGVSLGQNTLKYNQLIPKEAALSFATLHNSAVAIDPSQKQTFGASNTSSYSINSYDAKLLGFDFPVNVKYTLLEKKNTVYLSTGLSSNLFINEAYTYRFDYQMNSKNSTQLAQQSTSTFDSFDFARVLNFSLGLDHRLNNQIKVIFEPFIKYPLSGLGANDLKFGAAGMNLKLNFNRLK